MVTLVVNIHGCNIPAVMFSGMEGTDSGHSLCYMNAVFQVSKMLNQQEAREGKCILLKVTKMFCLF